MELFDREKHDELLNFVPLDFEKKFILAFDKMVGELNKIETEYKEKYKEQYPDFNLDEVVSFYYDKPKRKLTYSIVVTKNYNKIDYADQQNIQQKCGYIIKNWLNEMVIRYID
jgi:hypothetical protein